MAPAAGPRRHRGQERRSRAADENEETKEDFEWLLREIALYRRQGRASGPIMFTDGFDGELAGALRGEGVDSRAGVNALDALTHINPLTCNVNGVTV
jgi:hypothetical protein